MILSFCIPTYNRPEELKECILDILQYRETAIEIIISDNSTNDATLEMIDSLKDKRVRYFKNETNIGRSHNILKALERSDGEYAILLSDEDRFSIAVIPKIIDNIKEKDSPFVILGSYKIKFSGKIFSYPKQGKYLKGKNAVLALPFQGQLRPIVIKKSAIDFEDLYSYADVMYMQQYISYDLVTKGDLLICSDLFGVVDDWEQNDDLPLEVVETMGDYESIRNTGFLYFSPEYRSFQFREYMKLLKRRMNDLDTDVVVALFKFYYWSAVTDYQFSVCFEKSVLRDFGKLPLINTKIVMDEVWEENKNFILEELKDYKIDINKVLAIKEELNNNFILWKIEYDEFKCALTKGTRLILFGASQRGKNVYNIFKQLNYEVTAFCDNNKSKWGTIYEGIPVISPNQLEEDDIIWISSTYNNEIKLQLEKLGYKGIDIPKAVIGNLEYW